MPEDNTKNHSLGEDSSVSSAPDGSLASQNTLDSPSSEPIPNPLASGAQLPADPLTDGTLPTILASSHSKRRIPDKGFASISRIYRRADIATTLITLIVSLVLAALIVGGYLYFSRPTAKITTLPKITSLDKTNQDLLNNFLSGNASPQNSDILYINSTSLFKHRVAIDNDLKVTGSMQASGPTSLGILTVDKLATLGVTNIRGQLGVDGPTTLRGPAVLNAGASLVGNLIVSGNGSFGGSLAANIINSTNLSVTGILNLAGHLAVSGTAPSVRVEPGAGAGATAQIDGNETSGTVTFSTGTGAGNGANTGGMLVTVIFRNPYPRAPKVLISPIGSSTGSLRYYIQKTAGSFSIGVTANPGSNASYAFDYWVVQ